jgi:hypothetical protein
MSAHRLLRSVIALSSALAVPSIACAQGASSSGWSINLTEEPEPDSPAWEDPARVSLTIDPDGPDRFSAQVNLEVEQRVARSSGRSTAFGGNLIWNRESGGDDPQNNLEAGLFYSFDYDTGSLTDPEDGSTPEQQENFIDVRGRASVDYARTAQYPDLTSPTCVATPQVAQCGTQFAESIRGSAAIVPFTPVLENQRRGFAYSIGPKFGVDYDHLINSPLDDGGAELRGGYLSALAGLAVSIVPRFDDRDFEIAASVQLRQRLFASDSRRPDIENSALLFEASATYYLITPEDENDWRAGIGITYTRGDDPLTGRSNVNRIVLAFRLGQF